MAIPLVFSELTNRPCPESCPAGSTLAQPCPLRPACQVVDPSEHFHLQPASFFSVKDKAVSQRLLEL